VARRRRKILDARGWRERWKRIASLALLDVRVFLAPF
jgi:hypothetical protein